MNVYCDACKSTMVKLGRIGESAFGLGRVYWCKQCGTVRVGDDYRRPTLISLARTCADEAEYAIIGARSYEDSLTRSAIGAVRRAIGLPSAIRARETKILDEHNVHDTIFILEHRGRGIFVGFDDGKPKFRSSISRKDAEAFKCHNIQAAIQKLKEVHKSPGRGNRNAYITEMRVGLEPKSYGLDEAQSLVEKDT